MLYTKHTLPPSVALYCPRSGVPDTQYGVEQEVLTSPVFISVCVMRLAETIAKYNKNQLLLNTFIGPIDKIMNILKLQSKGKQKSIMNEQHVEVNNVLLDLITD
jgi:hypothetical protein